MIDYALLGLLREQPDYGYRLKQRFEERMGAVWRLNIGQIYQTLRHLERRGLVAEVAAEAHAGRTRRLYDLTEKGRRALDRWLARPAARFRPVRDETLVRLLVLPAEQQAVAREQVARLEQLYRQLLTRLRAHAATAGDGQAGALRRLGLQGALLHTEAHLVWLGECRRHLEAGAAAEPVAALG